MELWDLESGYTVRSVRGHDEDTVTAIKVTMTTSNVVWIGGRAVVTRYDKPVCGREIRFINLLFSCRVLIPVSEGAKFSVRVLLAVILVC